MRDYGFIAVSPQYVAANIATNARIALCSFKGRAQGVESASWQDRGGEIKVSQPAVPITDRSYWENRYVLTELQMARQDGTKMTINDVTVNISRSKNIVKTVLTGLDGTIKEYICNGDWEISMSVGIVAIEDGKIVDEYPEEGVREIREFLDTNQALDVSSVFLDLFDINRIVVESCSLKQETWSNRQVVTIKALSDVDYQIKCTEY